MSVAETLFDFAFSEILTMCKDKKKEKKILNNLKKYPNF